jgi:S-adenosylmethionine hydrolase
MSGLALLSQAAETFPPGSIFVAVVDPGVGTKRKCILLLTKNGLIFVGPDNGIFTLAAEKFGVSGVYEITNRALMRPTVSPTFHGRDIMAPVAAHLSLGAEPAEVGPPLKTFKRLTMPRPRIIRKKIRGIVLNVDNFGNVITNIEEGMISSFVRLGKKVNVKIGGQTLSLKFARTFGDVEMGAPLCYVGSGGFLELARNRGNLAAELKVKAGESISIWK